MWFWSFEGAFEVFVEDGHVFLVGDVAAAHRLEMWGFDLAVDEAVFLAFEGCGEIDECYL